jgi:putative tricarboxylic transport membrane protein
VKFNDAIVGAMLSALGIAILIHIQSYPLIPGQQYGPALFPGVIAVGLVATGAVLVVRGVRQRSPLIVLEAWIHSPTLAMNFLAICGALVFYIVAAEPLGFIPTMVICLVALFLKLGVRLLPAAVIAIVATLVIHLMFYKLLRVPLPWGVLERYAW